MIIRNIYKLNLVNLFVKKLLSGATRPRAIGVQTLTNATWGIFFFNYNV